MASHPGGDDPKGHPGGDGTKGHPGGDDPNSPPGGDGPVPTGMTLALEGLRVRTKVETTNQGLTVTFLPEFSLAVVLPESVTAPHCHV